MKGSQMKKTLIVNAHVISPGVDLRRARIVLKGRKIESVEPMETKSAPPAGFDEVVAVRGTYVVPGFIDVHLHGASGQDVCDATPEAIAASERSVRTVPSSCLPGPASPPPCPTRPAA